MAFAIEQFRHGRLMPPAWSSWPVQCAWWVEENIIPSSQVHSFDTATTGIMEVQRTNRRTSTQPCQLFCCCEVDRGRCGLCIRLSRIRTRKTRQTTTDNISAQSSQIGLRVYMSTHTVCWSSGSTPQVKLSSRRISPRSKFWMPSTWKYRAFDGLLPK